MLNLTQSSIKIAQRKKEIASKKIDEELDFNKMFLGDQINATSSNKKNSIEKTNIEDTIEMRNNSDSGSKNTYQFNSKQPDNGYVNESYSNSDDKMDKFKNMQGVGSDMLNDQQNQAQVSIKNYSNCQALSSDQLFGRDEPKKSATGEFLASYEWEDK